VSLFCVNVKEDVGRIVCISPVSIPSKNPTAAQKILLVYTRSAKTVPMAGVHLRMPRVAHVKRFGNNETTHTAQDYEGLFETPSLQTALGKTNGLLAYICTKKTIFDG
jgi:hypothetical protein